MMTDINLKESSVNEMNCCFKVLLFAFNLKQDIFLYSISFISKHKRFL